MGQISNKGFFGFVAEKVAYLTGRPAASLTAFVIVILWALAGPIFHFSNEWALVINTLATVITFLMVFLIQNMQNRDTKALHLKLDELIRVTEGAHTTLLGLDELSDSEMRKLHEKYKILGSEAHERVRAGGEDTDIPEVSVHEHLEP